MNGQSNNVLQNVVAVLQATFLQKMSLSPGMVPLS